MLRVAYATKDGLTVGDHFGWCRRFDVYDVDPEGSVLVEARELPEAPTDEVDKIATRLESIRDCTIIHVCDIGGSAAAKVVNARIHPVKVPEGTAIADLVTRLEAVLGGTPPPWLRKLMTSPSNPARYSVGNERRNR